MTDSTDNAKTESTANCGEQRNIITSAKQNDAESSSNTSVESQQRPVNDLEAVASTRIEAPIIPENDKDL